MALNELGLPPPVTPDTSNAAGDPWLDLDPLLLAPNVPGGVDHPGRGVTTVNVAAIKLFATNVEKLVPWIKILIDELDEVTLGPGRIGAAHNLLNAIMGDNQLRDSTRLVLTQAQNILIDVAAACRSIAARYTTAEDLNALDMEEFAHEVARAKGAINNLDLGAA